MSVTVLPPDEARGHEPLVGVKIQLYNRRMRKAREAAGMSQKGLGLSVGISPNIISAIETFRYVPTSNMMNLIATALEDVPEHMFPDAIRELRRTSTIAPEFYLAADGIRLDTPADGDRDIEAAERQVAARLLLEQGLPHLTPRQRRVIDLRFGLDGGGQRTLREVGEAMGVQTERARQIEATALERLRARIGWNRIEAMDSVGDGFHECEDEEEHVPRYPCGSRKTIRDTPAGP